MSRTASPSDRRNFSFEVFAKEDVVFPEHFLQIGEGPGVFNLTLTNLDAFLAQLQENEVRVICVHALDEFEEVPPVTLDLPVGEEVAPFLLRTSS